MLRFLINSSPCSNKNIAQHNIVVILLQDIGTLKELWEGKKFIVIGLYFRFIILRSDTGIFIILVPFALSERKIHSLVVPGRCPGLYSFWGFAPSFRKLFVHIVRLFLFIYLSTMCRPYDIYVGRKSDRGQSENIYCWSYCI